MSATEFQKLWVIESLGGRDLKTGRSLVSNQLVDAQHTYPDLEIGYETPSTTTEMLALLECIRDAARTKGTYPMLHFECHGNKNGLGTSGGDLVRWEELRDVCIEINHACRLNLMVTLAACNGIYFIRTAEKLDRAPFFAVIGPEYKVTEGTVERDFGAFYTKLFHGLDGDAATATLNRGGSGTNRDYHFSTSEAIFLRAYARYHRDECTGDGFATRREKMLSIAQSNPEFVKQGEESVVQVVDAALSSEEEKRHFQRTKDRYFFIKEFPENANRFLVSYNDVIARAAQLD